MYSDPTKCLGPEAERAGRDAVVAGDGVVVRSSAGRDGSRAGFALPAAILALAVVAVLITGGFHMANQEQRVGVSGERATHAFYVAEDGLSRMLLNWSPSMAGSQPWEFGDTIEYPVPRGTAQVQAMQVDDRLFYLRSTGVVDEGGALTTGASRSLGMMVRQSTAQFPIEGALTTQGGVSLRGSSEIHGEDEVPPDWGSCPAAGPDQPGVAVGEGGEVDIAGGNEDTRLTGDPPWEEDTSITDETFEQFGELSWQDLIQAADIRIPIDGSSGGTHTINNTSASLDGDGNCDTWDMATETGELLNWGYPYERNDPTATLAPCHDWFPVIYVDGNAEIQSNGYAQGILLVEGNLDLRGDFNFFGIIIAQGQLLTQGGGNPRIMGAAIARNADLDLQTYVGSSVIQYSSCAVEEAIENAGGLTQAAPLARRGWVDLVGAGL